LICRWSSCNCIRGPIRDRTTTGRTGRPPSRKFDRRYERPQQIWSRLGYIDAQHLAARIQAEALFVVSLMDQVCPPSTQFAAYNKIRSAKHQLLYPDCGHEWMPDLSDRIYRFIVDGTVHRAMA
jgi:cephalosporin-C deacetylase-like acetyl esterase